MVTEPVPFLDLVAVNGPFRTEFELASKSVFEHARYVGGPEVDRFEDAFAAYCGTLSSVGVGNGTDALELILAGLGIGRGDEVIVPSNTFIATVEAICAVGARPRFVDVLPDTLLIDPDAVKAAVRPVTAGIVAVHLFGQMADMDALESIARPRNLALVEDAAQGHGARLHGRPAGSIGDAAAFSFYPGKNLGALGDGGAVVTNQPDLADRIRGMANHGREKTNRYRHDQRGRNSRLDTLQAAFLSIKLANLHEANAARARAMKQYRSRLPCSVRPVAISPGSEPVYHLAVVQVEDRSAVTSEFDRHGIGWGIHYPIPCHRQPAYTEFADECPIADEAAKRILSLPMSPVLTAAQVDRVCDVLSIIAD